MSRSLLLLSLDWTRPKDPPLSLGHASILANLLKYEIDVIDKSWSVNHTDFDANEIVEFIMCHADVDVALGAFVWNEFAIQHITKRLHYYRFPGRIILGGPQISYLKSGLEQMYPYVDIFVRGYAEFAMVKLMQHYPNQVNIQGVHFANSPDLGLTANISLEALPSPYLENVLSPQHFIRWETQRGCPFRCSFCQHREPDKVLMKRRNLSLRRIRAEANWIMEAPIIQDIAILDPIFNSGPDYLKVLEYLIGYKGKLALQSRMEMVTPDFLNAIDKINETGHVVLEFGLQTIHDNEQKLIQRNNNMKKIEHVLEEVKRRKIECEISLIFGLPGQTLTSFQQSVQYCIDKKVKTIHAFPLMLLRGTLLYEEKQQWNLIESDEVTLPQILRVQQHIPHVIKSNSFNIADWLEMAKIAEELEIHYNTVK